jgi:arginine decarboxylase-like protein
MVLSSIFTIFQVIYAFRLLGHKGYTAMIKLRKLTTEIIKNPFCSFSMFQSLFPCFSIPQSVEIEPLKTKVKN